MFYHIIYLSISQIDCSVSSNSSSSYAFHFNHIHIHPNLYLRFLYRSCLTLETVSIYVWANIDRIFSTMDCQFWMEDVDIITSSSSSNKPSLFNLTSLVSAVYKTTLYLSFNNSFNILHSFLSSIFTNTLL